MDPLRPICVFSLGSDRQIHYFFQYQATSEQPKMSITPREGSLYIMEPGCQSYFIHPVPSTRKSGPRFSLSFRKIVPDNSAPSVQVPVTCALPELCPDNTSTKNNPDVLSISD